MHDIFPRLWSNEELNSPMVNPSGLAQAVSMYYLALGAYILSSTELDFPKTRSRSINREKAKDKHNPPPKTQT